ncbi:MAG TPA: DUF6427 family protein [Bacteroidales bacterium]|nr:DUF6427 family protein [Bacteroidales bacterium]HOR61182.1 DUF6427 family protein [Bacteroidales bacterium]
MIKLLKSNSPLNYLLIFGIMLVFWAFKFVFMPSGVENYEVYGLFQINFGHRLIYQYLNTFIGFVIYFLLALLLVKANSDLQIVENSYQSPGMVFAFLSGAFINIQEYNNVLISCLLVSISIAIILYSIKKHIALDNAFNAGLVFAIATIFYPKTIVFLPILIASMFIVKPTVAREVISLFLGILTPLILFFSYFWLFGDIDSIILKTKLSFTQDFIYIRFSYYNKFIFVPLIFICIYAIIAKFTLNVSQKLNTRKFQTIVLIYSIYSLVVFLVPFMPDETVVFLYPSISLLLTLVLVNSKARILKIISLIAFAGLIVSHLFQIYFYLSIF